MLFHDGYLPDIVIGIIEMQKLVDVYHRYEYHKYRELSSSSREATRSARVSCARAHE